MLRSLLLSVVVLMAAVAPAGATVQVGQFSNDGSNALNWTNTGNTSAALTSQAGGAPGYFTFTNVPGLPAELAGPQAAHMIVTATTVADGFTADSQLNQPFTGTITIRIVRDTPDPNFASGSNTNLLTATITSGPPLISGTGGSAALISSTPRDNLTYNSDFVNLTGSPSNALTLALTSITPQLSFNTANGRVMLNNFTASGSAIFSAAVPEPSSVALLGLGAVVLVGARRRFSRQSC